MNNKRAKILRRLSEDLTIGMPKQETRKQYKRLKKVHKSLNKNQK